MSTVTGDLIAHRKDYGDRVAAMLTRAGFAVTQVDMDGPKPGETVN